MHLLVDIGNSTIVFAIAGKEGNITETWRFKTMKGETNSFFPYELKSSLKKLGIAPSDIKRISVSSVVPEINGHIIQSIKDIIGVTPHLFSLNDALRVIDIDVEAPAGLGKDRLADAIGAASCYGVPAIVIDMGTATTIGIINKDKCFVGGMIIPGAKTSLKALSHKASQLPMINLEKPADIIGRNTQECMQSGVLYGNAAMVDGIIDRIQPALEGNVHLIATGGLARQIIPLCHHQITIDDNLLFKGLFIATREVNNK
ncbi:MAG: type III pantothenate kinase [Bacteroidales bacterium]|nr:type III pantothenate kinase [Bacteroidales bacterium]